MTEAPFVNIHKGRSFTKVKMTLWQVGVYLQEPPREIKIFYADQNKALTIAERIATKLYEKVTKRKDAMQDETLQFEYKGPWDYKLVWWRMVKIHGEHRFVAMKDYVNVEEATWSAVVVQPGSRA